VQTFTLAGFCAGLTEAVIINPFEVVKVTLQAERGKFTEVTVYLVIDADRRICGAVEMFDLS